MEPLLTNDNAAAIALRKQIVSGFRVLSNRLMIAYHLILFLVTNTKSMSINNIKEYKQYFWNTKKANAKKSWDAVALILSRTISPLSLSFHRFNSVYKTPEIRAAS